MIAGGLLTGGQLASFAMYTMSVSSGITATMKVYSRIMEVAFLSLFVVQALGASQRVFELTANPFKPVKGSGLDRYYSEKNHTTDMAFTSQDSFKGEIQLNDVTFAYPQEPNHIVLHGISGLRMSRSL